MSSHLYKYNMNAKLMQFIIRNKKRNAHLYQPGLTEGYDYVVCPISGERLSMIKENYITKILGMAINEYPNVQRTCLRRKDNIKHGLQKIDAETGLTRYEIGQIKARKILNQVDNTGISGYKKKGQKTRATHLSRVDEFGRNGYSQLATKAIVKGNQTKAKKGIISLESGRSEFRRYKLVVLHLTEKYRKELTSGYVTGLAGASDAWHIDHQFSILKGYQFKVSPFIIGGKHNLKMLPWYENISKNSKCSIDLDSLLMTAGYTQEKSESEYHKIMHIISDDIKNNLPPNAGYLLERYYESILRS